MAALTPMTLPITILARVGDSDVLNEIRTVEMTLDAEAVTDENRGPDDAPEAVMRATVSTEAIADALRAAADVLDPPRRPEHERVVADALTAHGEARAARRRGLADADQMTARYERTDNADRDL